MGVTGKDYQPDTDDLSDIRGSARDFAIAAARCAADSRVANIIILDVKAISGLADCFVIGTGTSERQMRSVIESIRMFAKEYGRKPLNLANKDGSSWLLADFSDVIIHLFDEKARDYYALDDLWADAPRIDWKPAEDENQ